MELKQEEKDLLRVIVADKFSVGAFSGMITNLSFAHPEQSVGEITQKALAVRLKLKELIQ